MARTTRSQNLDLIRWLNFGHENTAKKLINLTNANYLSKMATGDMEITDHMARNIELTLNMPVGWLDRDNLSLINMSALDSELCQAASSLSDASKTALLTLIRTLS
jgi:hypothetical protein